MSRTPRLPDSAISGADGGVTEATSPGARPHDGTRPAQRCPFRRDRPRAFRSGSQDGGRIRPPLGGSGTGRARYRHLARGCGVLAAPGQTARRPRPGPVDHDGATARMGADDAPPAVVHPLAARARQRLRPPSARSARSNSPAAATWKAWPARPQPGGTWTVRGGRLSRVTARPGDSRMSDTLLTLSPGARPRREIAPGAVHVPSWLTPGQRLRWWRSSFVSGPPVPCRSGPRRSAGTRCPYRLSAWAGTGSRTATPGTLPTSTASASCRSRIGWCGSAAGPLSRPRATRGQEASTRPDAALVNFYDRNARLGMHQDKDERSAQPVVSLSMGDSCTFRFRQHQGSRATLRGRAARLG